MRARLVGALSKRALALGGGPSPGARARGINVRTLNGGPSPRAHARARTTCARASVNTMRPSVRARA